MLFLSVYFPSQWVVESLPAGMSYILWYFLVSFNIILLSEHVDSHMTETMNLEVTPDNYQIPELNRLAMSHFFPSLERPVPFTSLLFSFSFNTCVALTPQLSTEPGKSFKILE